MMRYGLLFGLVPHFVQHQRSSPLLLEDLALSRAFLWGGGSKKYSP